MRSAMLIVLILSLFETLILNVSADQLEHVQPKGLYLSTCARMNDGPIGEKVAQLACGASCNFRNCGNSQCEFRGNRAVCVCSRCANGGGGWPGKK
ncbi:unnamed protein product [Adineta ricciae]|uniref:Uncharacterized protein n=1 Tax=Adineta ricciae TaxID=249248 RepID=A0A815CKL1_ADIRI|nr:unnamed protein product [Adineta ricciae]CAF1653472.1 unnamed protein product [Adineta ricciae]